MRRLLLQIAALGLVACRPHYQPGYTLEPARWNERVQRTRTAAGVKAIPIENGPREMIAALRKQEGLAVLVANLARARPVMLFLDDVHVADASSWDALDYLARTLPSAPAASS